MKSAAILLLTMLAVTSCSPEGIDSFYGNYTFKAGGYLVLSAEHVVDNEEGGETDIPEWPFKPGDDDTDNPDDTDSDDTESPEISADPETLGDTEGDIEGSGDDSEDSEEDPEVETEIITKTVSIVSESGQMDIFDYGDGTALITMNILGGTALVVKATYEDDELVLEPFTRIVNISLGESSGQTVPSQIFPSQMAVSVSGTARKYQKMIVFDISYYGEVVFLGDTYTVEESHVEMIAKVNP